MQNHSNHSHPTQPIQAPPLLQAKIFERIHKAEQTVQEKTNFTTAFANSDWTLRLAAVEQLAQIERAIALPWLERALADGHPSVRAWAVHVADQHQVPTFIHQALNDPDWQVREAALLALKSQDAPSPEHIPLTSGSPEATLNLTEQKLFYQPPNPDTGGKPQMIPMTNQPAQPLISERNHQEPGTQQSIRQRPGRKRSRIAWSLIAASVALLIVLGNFIALKFLGQHSGRTTTTSHPIGTILYTHSFPQSSNVNTSEATQLGTLAWSPDGQRLALAAGPLGRGQVYIWDALTGAHQVVLTPSRSTNPNVNPEVYAAQVAWSPDGKLLASAIGDVQIWDPATGVLVKRLFPNVDSTATVHLIAWSPDGRYLAGRFNSSGSAQGIAIWNVETGALVRTLSLNVGSMAWSPDGKYLAITGNAGIGILSTVSWNVIQSIPFESGVPLAWSPDSTSLAAAMHNGDIEVLAIPTGKVMLTYRKQDQQGSKALVWSPDGQRIVSASDLSIQIWDARSGLTLFTYASQTGNNQGNPSLGDLTWSPDGQYIASSTQYWPTLGGGGSIQVWQAR